MNLFYPLSIWGIFVDFFSEQTIKGYFHQAAVKAKKEPEPFE